MLSILVLIVVIARAGQFPYDEPFEFACDSCSKTIKVPKLDKRLGKKKAKKKAD